MRVQCSLCQNLFRKHIYLFSCTSKNTSSKCKKKHFREVFFFHVDISFTLFWCETPKMRIRTGRWKTCKRLSWVIVFAQIGTIDYKKRRTRVAHTLIHGSLAIVTFYISFPYPLEAIMLMNPIKVRWEAKTLSNYMQMKSVTAVKAA